MPLFGRFTERAQKVFSAAREAAIELRQTTMGTEHLLMGLLRADDSIPEAISQFVTEDKVRGALAEYGDTELPQEMPQGGLQHMDLSPRAKQLMELSVL